VIQYEIQGQGHRAPLPVITLVGHDPTIQLIGQKFEWCVTLLSGVPPGPLPSPLPRRAEGGRVWRDEGNRHQIAPSHLAPQAGAQEREVFYNLPTTNPEKAGVTSGQMDTHIIYLALGIGFQEHPQPREG
jgi:hypothetical protein